MILFAVHVGDAGQYVHVYMQLCVLQVTHLHMERLLYTS